MNAKKPKLVICASASFFKQVVELSYDLEGLDLEIVLPDADMSEKKGDNYGAITDWSNHPGGYHEKAVLIREHFNQITECDAVLVTNYEKHGKQNYIGPNVLIEMAIAFYLNKPIYILNDQPDDSPLIDEILGLEPIFLRGNIQKLKELLIVT